MAYVQHGFDGHQPLASRTTEMDLDRGVRGCFDRLSTYCQLPACKLSQHEKSQLEGLEARYSYWEKDVVALRNNRDLSDLDVAQNSHGMLTKQDLTEKLDLLKKTLQDVEQMSLALREERETNSQDWDSDERRVLELKEEVSAKSISPHHVKTQNDHVPSHSTNSLAADKFILAKHIITSLHKITSYLVAVEPTETPLVQAIGIPDLLLDTKTLSAKYLDLAKNSPWLLERLARASGTARQRLVQRQKHHQAATQTDKSVGSQPIEHPEKDGSSYVSLLESRPNNEPPKPLLVSLMSTSPQMPAVPKNAKNGPVYCQLCYEVVDLGYRHTEAKWCQHVLQDLKPYVCTFDNCDAPSFASPSQWFEHELEMHRQSWTCDFCSTSAIDDPTAFAFHVGGCLARSRDSSEGLLDLPTIMTACQGPIDIVRPAECLFCGYEWISLDPDQKASETSTSLQQYRDHVAKHLVDSALILLQQSLQKSDNENIGEKNATTPARGSEHDPKSDRYFTPPSLSQRTDSGFWSSGRTEPLLDPWEATGSIWENWTIRAMCEGVVWTMPTVPDLYFNISELLSSGGSFYQSSSREDILALRTKGATLLQQPSSTLKGTSGTSKKHSMFTVEKTSRR